MQKSKRLEAIYSLLAQASFTAEEAKNWEPLPAPCVLSEKMIVQVNSGFLNHPIQNFLDRSSVFDDKNICNFAFL